MYTYYNIYPKNGLWNLEPINLDNRNNTILPDAKKPVVYLDSQ